jgi:hypothetical protein
MRKKVLEPSLMLPCYMLGMSTRRDNWLNDEGWIVDKSCLVTTDTGASMTIARPDITAAQPERKPIRPYVL